MADVIETNSQKQSMYSAELCASTRIICLLVKLWQGLSTEDYAVLQSALVPTVIDGLAQQVDIY